MPTRVSLAKSDMLEALREELGHYAATNFFRGTGHLQPALVSFNRTDIDIAKLLDTAFYRRYSDKVTLVSGQHVKIANGAADNEFYAQRFSSFGYLWWKMKWGTGPGSGVAEDAGLSGPDWYWSMAMRVASNFLFRTRTPEGNQDTPITWEAAWATGLHEYIITWEPTRVQLYIDNVLKATHRQFIPQVPLEVHFRNADASASEMWVQAIEQFPLDPASPLLSYSKDSEVPPWATDKSSYGENDATGSGGYLDILNYIPGNGKRVQVRRFKGSLDSNAAYGYLLIYFGANKASLHCYGSGELDFPRVLEVTGDGTTALLCRVYNFTGATRQVRGYVQAWEI